MFIYYFDAKTIFGVFSKKNYNNQTYFRLFWDSFVWKHQILYMKLQYDLVGFFIEFTWCLMADLDRSLKTGTREITNTGLSYIPLIAHQWNVINTQLHMNIKYMNSYCTAYFHAIRLGLWNFFKNNILLFSIIL